MLLKVVKDFVQGPYSQLGGSQKIQAAIEKYDELLTTVMTSCWLS